MAAVRWTRSILWLAFAAVLVLVIGFGVAIAQRAASFSLLPKSEPPRVPHDLVVQQLQDVAKLVSTEMTLRDVVVYDATRYGFAKRALLVVSCKVRPRIDSGAAPDVKLVQDARRLRIPPPR